MIKALIPVRAGSQRVKNKNIRPFAGSNLLEIKVKQMLSIKELDGVIVNSDSDEMLDIAKSIGADVFKREAYYASSEVSANDLYRNIAETTDADLILYTHVTNPLLKTETIRSIINKYKELNREYDSVSTVSPVKEFLWRDGKPINYDVNNKPRSQDLPEIYSLNHAINLVPRRLMYERKDLMGYKPYFYILDDIEAIDIDNELDFEFAEFLYKKAHNSQISSNPVITIPQGGGGLRKSFSSKDFRRAA
ncbi:acylneuraminate cytidylyltransferase family protein [bacterium]|nr:acylneuraminate cytidylyltransferase family protein [bacterium]